MKHLKYFEEQYRSTSDPETYNHNDNVLDDYYFIDFEMDETEPPNKTGRDDRETKNKTKKSVYKQSL
jgi:hypothetical protein